MRRFILILFLAFAAFPSISAAEPPAGISIKSDGKVKVRVFKSFKSLQRKFGKEAVAELKEFDFKANVLVWEVGEFDADAKADVIDVVVSTDTYSQYVRVDISAGRMLEILRTPKRLEVRVMNDSPCMGGARKPQDQMDQCVASAVASGLAARKRIVLLSTPRKSLKVVAIEFFQMPPRPSAPHQGLVAPPPVQVSP